jgi:hypothetical protein
MNQTPQLVCRNRLEKLGQGEFLDSRSIVPVEAVNESLRKPVRRLKAGDPSRRSLESECERGDGEAEHANRLVQA